MALLPRLVRVPAPGFDGGGSEDQSRPLTVTQEHVVAVAAAGVVLKVDGRPSTPHVAMSGRRRWGWEMLDRGLCPCCLVWSTWRTTTSLRQGLCVQPVGRASAFECQCQAPKGLRAVDLCAHVVCASLELEATQSTPSYTGRANDSLLKYEAPVWYKHHSRGAAHVAMHRAVHGSKPSLSGANNR